MPASHDSPPPLLYLDRFTCVRQRDSLPGSRDTPYFLVFVGHPGIRPSCEVIRVTHDAWDDAIRRGDTESVNAWVHHGIRNDAVVVVGLLEQDWQRDIHDDLLLSLRTEMAGHWFQFVRRTEDLTARVLRAFEASVLRLLGNDALIQMCPLQITTHHGPLPTLNFAGHGALYRASFRLQSVLPNDVR